MRLRARINLLSGLSIKYFGRNQIEYGQCKGCKTVQPEVVPNPKARLLDQVREVIRFKHYSIGTSGWNREARQLPFSATFVRHAPVGIRLRYPNRPGIARAQGRVHDDDLYPCAQQAGDWGEESAGLTARRRRVIRVKGSASRGGGSTISKGAWHKRLYKDQTSAGIRIRGNS